MLLNITPELSLPKHWGVTLPQARPGVQFKAYRLKSFETSARCLKTQHREKVVGVRFVKASLSSLFLLF